MATKKKHKKKKSKLPYFLFVVGLLIMLYPLISQWYYRIEANDQITDYRSAVSELDEAEIAERIRLAEAYNHTLDPSRLSDPYTKEEEEGIAEYARMLEVNEKMGYIEVPKINQNIPIYAGTSENVLQKGAGHLEGTSLPVGGPSTHTVITAHRGLPTARLFTDLDKMEEGDVFYIHALGKVFAYEVDQILTVEPSNFDPVLVVEGEDYATLLTCTPYMINSHRLLVRGHRVEYVAEEDSIDTLTSSREYLYYLLAVLLLILLLILIIYRLRKRIKQIEKSKLEASASGGKVQAESMEKKENVDVDSSVNTSIDNSAQQDEEKA